MSMKEPDGFGDFCKIVLLILLIGIILSLF